MYIASESQKRSSCATRFFGADIVFFRQTGRKLPNSGKNGGISAKKQFTNQINFHLYHYAGNNPVKYVDPTGMWVDNEDGTYTAEEDDTLYGLYGSDWQDKSGFDRDPKTLQIGETVGKKREYHDLWESVSPTNIHVPNSSSNSKGQLMVGINLNFVGMIGADVSIGFLFNFDDSSMSGLFLSGGFAAGVSAGVSLFGGYNYGRMDDENLGTLSLGFGPFGGNLGIDSNANPSFSGSYSPIGLDAGFNFSKQHMIVLPFATEEEKNKIMERYYEHH